MKIFVVWLRPLRWRCVTGLLPFGGWTSCSCPNSSIDMGLSWWPVWGLMEKDETTGLRQFGSLYYWQIYGIFESMIFLLISWDMWSYQEVKLTTQFERFLRVVSKIATLKPPWCVKRFGCFEACERYEEFPPGHVFDSKSVALWHVEIS